MTNRYGEIEFVITPETFPILVFHGLDSRRIFTDGRDFPTDVDPSFPGISIGRWIDTKGDGHCDGWMWRRAIPSTGPGRHKQ